MISGVLGLVPFTSAPSLPYILYGHVDWQSQALGGVRIELTNQNTGYSTIITTNIDGYWQEEGSNWLTTSKSRPPIQFGDTIKVKTLDGCGTNDVCEKTFSAKEGAFENFAQIDLSISGVLVITLPPSGGGSSGGSSGGGGGGGSTPAWICEEWTVCDNGQQTRICTQGQFIRKEKQECKISEPIIEPIIVPPIEKPTIPTEPTTPTEPVIPIEPTEPIVPSEPESNLYAWLIGLIATIIGLFVWGKGFAALIKYKLKQADEAEKAGNKELAKKYRSTAEKMAKSVITNYMAGKYKK